MPKEAAAASEAAPVQAAPTDPAAEEIVDKADLASLAVRFGTSLYLAAGAFALAGRTRVPVSEFKRHLDAMAQAEV